MKVQNKSVLPEENVAIIAFLINPYLAIIYDNDAKSQKALERGLRGTRTLVPIEGQVASLHTFQHNTKALRSSPAIAR